MTVEVDVASECRYRDPVLMPGMLGVLVSHSGETADTLAAFRHMKAGGATTAGIINVPPSSIAREVELFAADACRAGNRGCLDQGVYLPAGVMAALAVNLARAKGRLDAAEEAEIVRHLIEAPAAINEALGHDAEIEAMAHTIAQARDVLYLGRGPDYALVLEGALKLKEISYIHAEGYAAGEMKHGPIALIDEAVPIIVIAASGPLFEKTVSNMQEVRARGGQVVLISDAEGLAEAG
ncbi:SIS domain protein [Blastomonas sp. RAC04]|nr:SIS domain protein [Blastomonas sp. RAC04]